MCSDQGLSAKALRESRTHVSGERGGAAKHTESAAALERASEAEKRAPREGTKSRPSRDMPRQVERRIAGGVVCVAAGVGLALLLAPGRSTQAQIAQGCRLGVLVVMGGEEVDEASCPPKTLDRGLT